MGLEPQLSTAGAQTRHMKRLVPLSHPKHCWMVQQNYCIVGYTSRPVLRAYQHDTRSCSTLISTMP